MKLFTIILLVLSLIANVYFYAQLENMDKQIQQTVQDKTVMLGQYDIIKRDKQRLEASLAFLRAPGNRSYLLSGTSKMPDASATVFWNKNTHKIYIDAKKMPPTKTGRQYQLWAETGDSYTNLGVFNHQPDKNNLFELKSTDSAKDFVLTLEIDKDKQPKEQDILAKGTAF